VLDGSLKVYLIDKMSFLSNQSQQRISGQIKLKPDIYKTKQIRKYEALSGKAGIPLPEKDKPKEGLFFRLLKPLSALEYYTARKGKLAKQIETKRKAGEKPYQSFLGRAISPESRELFKQTLLPGLGMRQAYREKVTPSSPEVLNINRERAKRAGLPGWAGTVCGGGEGVL